MSEEVGSNRGRRVAQTISQYRIIEEIGSGAMGTVYRAEDTRLGRIVALKFYENEACCSEEGRRRILEEARLAAAVHHPNICTIYEAGEHRGVPFIVMAYIRGTPVSDLIAGGPLPVPRALGITLQAARGLEAAHRSGVVHRDIKPENMVADEEGNIVLMDFGEAGWLSSADDPTLGPVGTAAYMSPELATDARLADHRTDIWSLGVCLYEMLAGRVPFPGDYVQAVIYSVLNEEPKPLSRFRSDVPPRVEHIVARAMSRNLADRYHSMSEMITDLERAGSGAPAEEHKRKDAPSIAVLPFADMSENGGNQHFCDGIAEEILNDLARLSGLRVAARTSSFAFRERQSDIREVGRRLNVDTVLEGSVRKSGNRVRVVAQLIDTSNGYHLWSGQYDETLEDVFAIQEQISRSIVESLEVTLGEVELSAIGQKRTQNVNAYDCYLRGRMLFYQSNRRSVEASCEMFERAIEHDPEYAEAYCGLADAYSYLQMYYDRDVRNLRLADANSRLALVLDPHLAEARASRGLALNLRGRHDDAAREFERAITLNPHLYEAYYFYARSCFAAGRLEQAVELYRKAAEVNPDEYQARSLLGFTWRVIGNDEKVRECALESLRATERHLELYPSDARAWYLGATAHLDLGEVEKGREWAEKAMAMAPDDPYNTYGGACFFSLVGDQERALDFFERSINNGFAHREWIEHDTDLDGIRDHPRFAAAMARLKGGSSSPES